jgi:hypothetical protein
LLVEVFTHAKVGGSGNAYAFVVEWGIKATQLFEFANGCRFIGCVLGNIDAVVVVIEEFFMCDEGQWGRRKPATAAKGRPPGFSDLSRRYSLVFSTTISSKTW